MAMFSVELLQDSPISAAMQTDTQLQATFDSLQSVVSSDYNDLANKPSINGTVLQGDKDTKSLNILAADTGAVTASDMLTNEDIEGILNS